MIDLLKKGIVISGCLYVCGFYMYREIPGQYT